MRQPDLAAEARRWLRYAEEDLTTAEMVLQRQLPAREACWLAQQAAEKALKAALVLEQVDFPKTHDLDALRSLVPEGWTVREIDVDLAMLSEWAVEARYPGNWPEPTEAEAANGSRDAGAVVDAVRIDLNLRVA
jgi:HEPN domain-containing protein